MNSQDPVQSAHPDNLTWTFSDLNGFNSADQNNDFANSVDPDETAHDDLSHQDLHCLPLCFDFLTDPYLEEGF